MAENFLISGDDDYLRAKEEKKIRDRFLTREEAELNFCVYTPEGTPRAIDDLGTAPFLAEKRVTVIRDIEGLSEESFAVIVSYLKDPAPTSVLILTSGSEFRKKPKYRDISSKVVQVSADKLTPQKIRDGIKAFFRKENIDISHDAVDLIFELKGSDPASIVNELEKLAAFSGGEKIEAAHVEELVGRSVYETVFQLVDAIDLKDAKRIFRILGDLAGQKKQVPEIIGYLAWHIRTVQKIKFLSSKGLGKEQIISAAGRGAYRILPKVQKYTAKKTEKWLNTLLEADLDVKKGRKEPFLALEMLVLKLAEA
jgi:DNA polymerase III subunit delta